MSFTPRMRLNGKRSSEIQILQEISDMIHGTGSRPYPIPITEVAKMLGVTRGTIYNYIKRMKGLSKGKTGRFLLPKIPSEKKFRQFNKDHPITSEPLVAEWIDDLMEPFRWLVDSAVCKMSDAKSRNRISKKQYAYTRKGNVVLEYDLIRNFLELLERNFQRARRYEYKHGAKTKDGLKSVQEITIAKIMVQNLAEYCTRKQKEFRI